MKYFIYCRKSTESEDRQIMSIDSQRAEVRRSFGDRSDIQIVQVYEESQSAKTPGRPLFADMMARIEAGEADGIVAWAPDRLARNSIDGGRIIYQLDCGALKDLKFATYTFENNPQGKFMLSIMFGQSKYYSDALSENVHRGLRAKLELGWRPSRPPIGYRTEPLTRVTEKDPVQFAMVRQLFDLMLEGDHTAKQAAIIARDQWGFHLGRNRQSQGKPISLASIYRLLANPFYAGRFTWHGQTYIGRHEPVVTATEFDIVRRRIEGPGKTKPQKHVFAYTGLMRCGGCGLMVTAELRTKPSGKRYAYYHCTKRGLGPRCPERPIQEADLERQFTAFVQSLAIPEELEAFILKALADDKGHDNVLEANRTVSLKQALSDKEREGQELTQLRIRRVIDDQEFLRQRERISQETVRLRQSLGEPEDTISPFELGSQIVSFNKYAVDQFSSADPATKREIIKIIGSNPTLRGKKLSIYAAKPFAWLSENGANLKMCTLPENVRTLRSPNPSDLLVIRELRTWIEAEPLKVKYFYRKIISRRLRRASTRRAA